MGVSAQISSSLKFAWAFLDGQPVVDSVKILTHAPNGTSYFEEVADNKMYSVATNSFMVSGGDGYVHKGVIDLTVVDDLYSFEWQAVEAYLRNKSEPQHGFTLHDLDLDVGGAGRDARVTQNPARVTPNATAAPQNETTQSSSSSTSIIQSEDEWLVVVVALMGVVVLLVMLAAICFRYQARRARLQAHDFRTDLEKLIADGELDMQAGDDGREQLPREIRRRCVSVLEKLGSGAFGDVYKAVIDERSDKGVPSYICAAKISKVVDSGKANEGRRVSMPGIEDELMLEATVMAQVVSARRCA